MVTIKCIPADGLRADRSEIDNLAEVIYGTAKSVDFNERYVPRGGRVPGSGRARILTFSGFLSKVPKCLVIVYEDGVCCGFMVVADRPFHNSVGFGIHPDFSNRGIMSEAWRLFLVQCDCVEFPLHAYTSVRNESANGFLVKNGFKLVDDDVDYMGERSNKYVFEGGIGPINGRPDEEVMPGSVSESNGEPDSSAGSEDQDGEIRAAPRSEMPPVKRSKVRARFNLTVEELSASVYYGAAGIDIQPLLRFGDMAKDYIYVNAGLDCDDFLKGVEHGTRTLWESHPGLLRLVEVAEIAPLPGPYSVGYPDFMSPGQRERYADTFGLFARDAGSCSRLLTFELRVGSETRTLRLWHFNGEAIATYDMMFLRRSLAPKVLITIQAGLLEKPGYIMDAMLAYSPVRPKVWVRGVWSASAVEIYSDMEVFDTYGIYDLKIWEARAWDAQFGCHIEGTTSIEKPYRHVAGYGESSVWNAIAHPCQQTVLVGRDLQITKRNEPHNPMVHHGYTRGVSPAVAKALAPHFGCKRTFRLDGIMDCEYAIAVPHVVGGPYTTFSRAHERFECFEMYADEFVRDFTPIHGIPLHIDLFYMWPLEYRRHF